MKLSDIDFVLPPELIAQMPAHPRDQAKLMYLDRAQDTLLHKRFFELSSLLRKGDLLVLNNTKVDKVRLLGKLNGKSGEIFVILHRGDKQYQCLLRPHKALKPTDNVFELLANENVLVFDVMSKESDGSVVIDLAKTPLDIKTILEQCGNTPFPPYIKADETLAAEYQTVFAEKSGSLAAPTAGLHFTAPLISDLREEGVEIAYLTHHVGLGTFMPIKTESIEEHLMHEESYELSTQTVEAVQQAKQRGNRIIACGTTVARCLEGNVATYGSLTATKGTTSIYIYPPYTFQVIDGLITNFHLPKSTLLLLVASLIGVEKLKECYTLAIEQHYRFFSFGDAMLIL